MMSHDPLDHCFKLTGAPGTDPVVHATLIEVQMWRMLQERRHADPSMDPVEALDRWTAQQRVILAREPDSEERDYRLHMLRIAAERVGACLHRKIADIATPHLAGVHDLCD